MELIELDLIYRHSPFYLSQATYRFAPSLEGETLTDYNLLERQLFSSFPNFMHSQEFQQRSDGTRERRSTHSANMYIGILSSLGLSNGWGEVELEASNWLLGSRKQFAIRLDHFDYDFERIRMLHKEILALDNLKLSRQVQTSLSGYVSNLLLTA